MDTRLRRLGAVVVVGIVALAFPLRASLQQSDPWPGASWPEATPASQGLSIAAFDALDRDARNSRDWIAFTLSQPMDAEPGTKWVYNSGGSKLLSGIIRNATGRFIDDYAREYLFTPIGIKDFHWKQTPTGHPDTEGGLYLSAEDLARIGYLYLRDGMWNGRRVLPEGWVKRATARHVKAAAPGWDYGYQWWIMSREDVEVWAGRGFGGQFLIVIPSRDIVAVANAWNVFGAKARSVFTPLVDALLKDEPPQ
jgi:CubicO group peptidase (beta-lactamase class C family)